jgi:hypothetical protein
MAGCGRAGLAPPTVVSLSSLECQFEGEVPIMATVLANLDEIKTAVINSLHNQTRRPIELLDSLSQDYPDIVIKEAVLRLLQEGDIEFTADRLLREKAR